jgi:hypothetical protein
MEGKLPLRFERITILAPSVSTVPPGSGQSVNYPEVCAVSAVCVIAHHSVRTAHRTFGSSSVACRTLDFCGACVCVCVVVTRRLVIGFNFFFVCLLLRHICMLCCRYGDYAGSKT